mmetsp:Transcript_514/g.1321  ORF Transcript_514/g.1321 Transcript_514/m.1321 type:complete len:301 (-) Transcript_514:43-945(-)
MDGQDSSVGVPSSRKMRISWSSSELPGKSGRPDAISPKMHPTDQISTGVEYLRLPINTSGARYHSVTTSCVYDRTGMPKARARPKSASLRAPSCLLMRRFCGLRSRWSTRRSWQKATPRRSWKRSVLSVRASTLPSVWSRNFLRSWSRNSKTRVSFFSVWITSRSRTMLGCWSSLRMEISRMAVLGMPSSSASRRIFLSATSSPLVRFFALYTTPYVPSPIFSTFSYLSAMASAGRGAGRAASRAAAPGPLCVTATRGAARAGARVRRSRKDGGGGRLAALRSCASAREYEAGRAQVPLH